ncbi:AEC family transporter [Vibrio sp. S17_S38]|uniref:AEC family transporter n=1 Tax=Vibrio sp. S17_S38 TaxID=2720229 RepID=UPI00168029AA|nr:AEC family transporter [Vibrio sp. S17_S38]MBD1572219.1 AEC family transporter [Vibrio sp. S17_S38]
MTELMQHFAFSISITGPICLMLLLGVLLRNFKMINDNFIEVASKLVFRVTLPALLFLSIIKSSSISSDSLSLVMFGMISTIVFFIFATITTRMFIKEPKDQGVIVQGAFRSNMAIIGLAYVSNAYGETGVAIAAIYIAGVTILYNILAVIALTPKSQEPSLKSYLGMLKAIIKNPLIIAITLALVASKLSVPVPEMVIHAGQYFAHMTLPLALLCAGGSLNIRELQHDKAANILASSYRLILCPLMSTLGAYWYGFEGLELGVIFFMTSSPAAAASYVMARSMGGNATLAANIIALTTVGSILTCSLGIILLSSFQLM